MNDTQSRDTLVEQIKQADNILIALSASPTIDELVAALGLNLILNKTNNHATTIFSGQIPSVLNFLQPTKHFDKTVDGLRDFIIALNPDKADRVRTKVVDGMVRVSITPSKGAVTVDDLEFTQGDYNVDLVIALGVKQQADLDKALESHGRILHSAYVAAICIGDVTSDLGNLNWHEPTVQSYAQIVADLSLKLDPKVDDDGQPVAEVLIDNSVATALMTGLVAITDRFSNERTTPEVMSLAAVLMEQGANQQLIAKELDEPKQRAALKNLLNQQKQAEAKPESVETPATQATQQVVADLAPVETTVEPKEATESKIDQLIDQMAKQKIVTDKQSAEIPVKGKESAAAPAAPVAAGANPAPAKVAVTTDAQTTAEVSPAVEPTAEAATASSASTKTDESWDKVNQFKQAFLDKMKQNQAQASQARQQELDKIKQQEAPEPPKADKPPVEVVEPQSASQSEVAELPPIEPPVVDSVSSVEPVPAEAAVTDAVSQVPVKSTPQPAAEPTPQSVTANEQPAAKTATESIRSKIKLKKKPAKVINPLAHAAEAGPNMEQKIAQELGQAVNAPQAVAQPLNNQATGATMANAPMNVPPMPQGMPLPPPLPPMPPELDQMTMTSLPPLQQPDFSHNPFDQLEQKMSTPTLEDAPQPQFMDRQPVAEQPSNIQLNPMFDAQLSPQEAQAISSALNGPVVSAAQPQPTTTSASSAPVPQNQFVIPE